MKKRKIERINTVNTNDYSAQVISVNGNHKYTVVDFNSSAVKLRSLTNKLSFNEKIISINIIYLNRIISSISSPSIIRNDGNGELIVDISHTNNDRTSRKSQRLEINEKFKPFLIVKDQIQIDRLLHFELLNISKDGAYLSTSLSNKHLLAGQIINNATLMLPLYGAITLSIELKRIQVFNDKLQIGAKISNLSDADMEKIGKFCLFGTNPDIKNSSLKEKLSSIKENIYQLKELGHGLKIEAVNNESDYMDVLKIRFLAYKKANKLNHEISNYLDCRDGFDKNSIILLARIGSEVVGTVRMVFSENGKTSFPFEDFLTGHEVLNNRESYYEVSKLAVDPLMQRSDIVVKLFREVARLTILNKKTTLCFSTRILRPMYKKIGFREISDEVPHPVLANESLALMKIDSDDFVFGNKMSESSWTKFSQQVVQNLEYGGLIPLNTEDVVLGRYKTKNS